VFIFSLSLAVFESLEIFYLFLTKEKLQNKFGTNTATWSQCYKTFFVRDLRIFVSS
jgi:hypothetical protein